MSHFTYSFGYSKHHREVWFYRKWTYGNDTMHEYWWVDTLGM